MRAWSSGEGPRRVKPMKLRKLRNLESLNRMRKNIQRRLKHMRKTLLMHLMKISVTSSILFTRCLLVYGDVIF